MKSIYRAKTILVAMLLAVVSGHAAAQCTTKFLNPITDVCWTCMLPITVMNIKFGGTSASGETESTNGPASSNPICVCNNLVGVPVSFFEPVRSVDVTRDPYCMVNLGIELDISNLLFDTPGEVTKANKDRSTKRSFYQVHFYLNPMLYWLELALDNNCVERQGFDLAYLTEADPSWVDDELNALLNPDAFLYGNIVAQSACTADCIAASAGSPIDALHWCAGCEGDIYPLSGHTTHDFGGVSTSSKLSQRLITKMHREGLMLGSTGTEALCGYYPQLMIKKSDYKQQITHPIPQTGNTCCQPFGSTSTIFGVGREFPVAGEDFGYLIFRKRDCCSGVIKP